MAIASSSNADKTWYESKTYQYWKNRKEGLRGQGETPKLKSYTFDEEKYHYLSNGMILKKSTMQQGLWIDGMWAHESSN